MAAVTITQERAERIVRELQPLAQEDQIAALAGLLRRLLAATPDRAAMTKLLADEIERWLRSDRIAMMYGSEAIRGEDVNREAAEDLAAILAQALRRVAPGATKAIQCDLRGGLWEVACEWGIFQAEDLSDALSACADAFAVAEECG